MNARDKVRAAALRRAPDELFAAEAERRGYARRRGRAMIHSDYVQRMIGRLQQAFVALTNDGGEVIHAVRSVRYVEQELQEYLTISREHDKAGAA